MKAYFEIFRHEDFTVKLQLSERGVDSIGKRIPDATVIKRYVAKSSGNISLIFDPKVAIAIGNREKSIIFSAKSIHNILLNFKRAYNIISAEDAYVITDDDDLVCARHSSVEIISFNDSLRLIPSVVYNDEEEQVPGITLLCRAGVCGTLTDEALIDLIMTIESMDMTQIAMLYAVIDEIQFLGKKVDKVSAEINDLRNLIKTNLVMIGEVKSMMTAEKNKNSGGLTWNSI